MDRLKIGAKVFHIETKKNGTIQEIQTSGYRVLVDGRTRTFFWYSKNTKPLTSSKDVGINMAQTEKTYSFHSSTAFDIDWKAVIADLTRKDPMAIIIVNINVTKQENVLIAETFKLISDLPTVNKTAEAKILITKRDTAISVLIREERYVVMHPSLKMKAQACNIALPNPQHKITADVLKIQEQFSVWIAWAKQVKQAPWPDQIRHKAIVQVTKVSL